MPISSTDSRLGSIAPAAVEYAAATGIIGGESLEAVRYFRGGAWTHTVEMSTEPRVVRFMDTIHTLEPEAGRRGFQL